MRLRLLSAVGIAVANVSLWAKVWDLSRRWFAFCGFSTSAWLDAPFTTVGIMASFATLVWAIAGAFAILLAMDGD